MAKLLLYTADSLKAGSILRLCGALKIQPVLLQASDFNCTVASLLVRSSPPSHESGTAKTPLLAARPELLIFSGFSDQQLDLFLAEYRKRGIAPIALRAVVTPVNFTWTVFRLSQELSKEHNVLG